MVSSPMCGIIDFHTHAFPDSLAERAMDALQKECEIQACLDGRLSSLLDSMDRAGIEKSVICSIATKPSQFDPIFSWSVEIASDRIIPFPSFHPADPQWGERVEQIKRAGFRGVKFHPYYQNFTIDEERFYPLYENLAGAGLIVVMHTGFDISFPRVRMADPEKIRRIADAVPGLKLVATHLGAWEDWDEVERHLIGREILMETSFALKPLGKGRARRMILDHPPHCILFGTDSPWTDQKEELSLLKALELDRGTEERILHGNARALLESEQRDGG